MNKQFLILVGALCVVSVYTLFQIGSPNRPIRSGVSYSHDIRPILETRCGTCHIGNITSADLHMDSYEDLLAGSENGPVILPGNAHDSLLVKKILAGEMPKRGPKLTPAQVQMIMDWIEAGAPRD